MLLAASVYIAAFSTGTVDSSFSFPSLPPSVIFSQVYLLQYKYIIKILLLGQQMVVRQDMQT
jgi:hypothetical protein